MPLRAISVSFCEFLTFLCGMLYCTVEEKVLLIISVSTVNNKQALSFLHSAIRYVFLVSVVTVLILVFLYYFQDRKDLSVLKLRLVIQLISLSDSGN